MEENKNNVSKIHTERNSVKEMTLAQLAEQVNANTEKLKELMKEVKKPSLFERIKTALKKKGNTKHEVTWGGQKYNINF